MHHYACSVVLIEFELSKSKKLRYAMDLCYRFYRYMKLRQYQRMTSKYRTQCLSIHTMAFKIGLPYVQTHSNAG